MTVNLNKGEVVTVQFLQGTLERKHYELGQQAATMTSLFAMIPECFCTWSKKTILQDFEIFARTTLSHLPWTDHWQAVE